MTQKGLAEKEHQTALSDCAYSGNSLYNINSRSQTIISE